MCWGLIEENKLNKHSVILPKGENVSNLIVQRCHICCAHGGRGPTLNKLWSSGYWTTSCKMAGGNFLFKCVKCYQLQGRPGEQKMADLPVHSLAEVQPWTNCGVDIFGSFVIKQNRNEIKCYGAMSMCMASRAVHIEITHSLDTDSFTQALRQVIAYR